MVKKGVKNADFSEFFAKIRNFGKQTLVWVGAGHRPLKRSFLVQKKFVQTV